MAVGVLIAIGQAASGSLSDALDTTLIFTTGGNAEWFAESTTSYYGGDAAQSGHIRRNQDSWMQTTVNGPGTIRFYWKVSSEKDWDLLEFYIDGSLQGRISGEVDWHQQTYTISTSGPHILRWRYVKDWCWDHGSDCGWVDKVVWESGSPPPPCSLSEAVDSTLSFTTGGDANWFCQNTTYYNGGDAAQSRDIGDCQKSWMLTTVTGPGTIRFYWKVSSEESWDFLVFYIDGTVKGWISGEVDWCQEEYTISTPGPHTLRWLYVKDECVDCNSDCGWVDKVEWEDGSPPTCSLSEALDSTLSYTTGGDANWFCQNTTYHFGGDAAQSGDIGNCQESWLQTIVNGPGTIRFYWKVSSEESWDFLELYVDGTLKGWISGEEAWCQQEYTITTTGLHTIRWQYVKDECVDCNSDCGWVDKVEWDGGPPPPPPCSLSEAVDSTLSFTTGGNANWFCQNTTFYYGGDAAQSGQIRRNQESWMQTIVDGPGTIRFYWKVSSEESWDFLEFYVDGSLKGWISGEEAWCQQEYAITTSGPHTLKWRYVKDQCVDCGSDCGWVDKVEWDGGSPPPPPCSLSEAVDSTLSFTTGGDANWFCQNTTFYFGGDAAQSGDIGNCQESWMQTTVTGPGTIRFYWKVSSEECCDFLVFYIDGSIKGFIRGEADWHQQTYTISSSGPHILRWRYFKNASGDCGSDSGWVDKVEWNGGSPPPPPPCCSLSEAVDSTLSFTTGGAANWFCQNTTYFYGNDAAQTEDVNHFQETWMQTTVNGPGTISFYWKVSSEQDFDFLEFYIDGTRRGYISGEVNWYKQEYMIGTFGPHTLRWRYVKDWCGNGGSDSAWVDKVVWESSNATPPSGPLEEALDTNLTLTTGGNANWVSQNTTSYYGGDAAQSGNINNSQESWLQTIVNGPGIIRFFWKVSSEESRDFLEFYIGDTLIAWISGEVNWCQQEFMMSTSTSHILRWRYVKDESGQSGSDHGWVDKTEWQPTPP